MEKTEQITCASCGFDHQAKFCPNCGEIGNLRRITVRAVAAEAFATLINMDKGFLYNLRELTFNPKKLVNDYLNGKRKGIFNPVSYLVIALSLYLILSSYFTSDFESDLSPEMAEHLITKIGYEAGKISAEYFKFYWIFSVLFLSLPSAFLFSKQNLAEHVATSAFIIGHSTFLLTLLLPIYNIPLLFNGILYAIISIMYFRIYSNKSRKIESITLSFVTVLLFIIQLFVFTFFLGVVSYFLF